jgi:hypothetical protein
VPINGTGTATYSNTKLGQIIVVKTSKGGTGNFTFTAAGSGMTPSPFPIVTTGAPNGSGNVTFPDLVPGTAGGSRSVNETLPLPAGWTFTGVGISSALGTSNFSAPSTTNMTATVLTLGAGDTVTITFENTAANTTRTQGFWQTHLALSDAVWFGGTIGGHTFSGLSGNATKTIGTHLIDDEGKLMGAFWSSVSQNSTKSKRTSLDQARMQLLQQLVAAILNNAAFGSSPSTMSIADAKAAFAGTDIGAIKAAMSAMASFNTGGDSGTFTPGVSANGKQAKDAANIPFWDVLP